MKLFNLLPTIRKRRDTGLYDPFTNLQTEIGKTIDTFFNSPLLPSKYGDWDVFSPTMDISETDKEYVANIELPGMDEKDIHISLERDHIVISGEKKLEKEDKKDNYHVIESSYGSFKRMIPITADMDTTKIDATFKKGVLKLTLPKLENVAKDVKRINIKTE
jgi:HSP20 family protein